MDGKVRPADSIPSLRVTIGSQIVRLPYEYGAMPHYEEEIQHHGVTDGE